MPPSRPRRSRTASRRSARRPVEWLLDNAGVDAALVPDPRDAHDRGRDARGSPRRGAVAGLCPLTEASSATASSTAPSYLAAGGRFGVGTDSNIQIDAAAELRQLEYSQRLRAPRPQRAARRRASRPAARFTRRRCRAARRRSDAPIGAIEAGPARRHRRAGCGASGCDERPATALDAYVFVAGEALVKDVMVGGEVVVADGRHKRHDAIAARYRKTIKRLSS